MERTSTNAQQEAALDKLLSALADRGFDDVRRKYKTVVTPTWLMVKLELPDFPIIRIGRGGGFDMPDIRSYYQKGSIDSFEYPGGRTAFDACLFGDEHARRQGSGTADTSPYTSLLWESP